MRDDFAVFILTHGRPDHVYTYKSLIKAGYTGKIYLVIDDEDKKADQYRALYGDAILTFAKRAIAETVDAGDNFNDLRSDMYVRNAMFALAREQKLRYFIQLDDDYIVFDFRRDSRLRYVKKRILSTLDQVFESLVSFLNVTPFASIAIAQGGDFMAGKDNRYAQHVITQRKAMNSFLCDVQKPFPFFGRLNVDVNNYTAAQRRGVLFMTTMQVALEQKRTQATAGGMTEAYLDHGTYVKSFYSVMYAPSCVKIAELRGPRHTRIHHRVFYDACAPCILPESVRKHDASSD